MKLRVYFEELPSIYEERIFNVEIVDPCLTATFTIDPSDDVFKSKASGLNTVHQFVKYAGAGIEWDPSSAVV